MPDRPSHLAGVVSREFVHHLVQQLRARPGMTDPLSHLLDAVDAEAESSVGTITVASGVSAFNGEPFVNVSWGEGGTQWDPSTARSHAMNVLGAADAAISDAAVATVLRRTGLDGRTVFGVVNDIRTYRAERDS